MTNKRHMHTYHSDSCQQFVQSSLILMQLQRTATRHWSLEYRVMSYYAVIHDNSAHNNMQISDMFHMEYLLIVLVFHMYVQFTDSIEGLGRGETFSRTGNP